MRITSALAEIKILSFFNSSSMPFALSTFIAVLDPFNTGSNGLAISKLFFGNIQA